jgi:hypothetical protein
VTRPPCLPLDHKRGKGLTSGAVALKDWVHISALQAESRRTTAVAAALLSFFIISWLVKWAVGPGRLATWIGYIDDFVLVVVFLFYAGRLLYDVFKELTGAGNANVALVA